MGGARTKIFLGGTALLLATAGGAYLVHGVNPPPLRAGTRGITAKPHNAPAPTPTTLPFAVTGITPAPGTTSTSWSPSVEVHFSEPLAADSPDPVITPEIAGSWHQSNPYTLSFIPLGNFAPGTRVTVRVARGTAEAADVRHGGVTSAFHASFSVPPGSTLRLQQLLAGLGELPLTFTPRVTSQAALVPAGTTLVRGAASSSTRVATGELGATLNLHGLARGGVGLSRPLPALATGAASIPLAPQPGTFAWRYPNIPSPLAGLWRPGVFTTMTRGAVMAFQAARGLDPTGIVDGTLWKTLLAAAADNEITSAPYDFIVVSETVPETLSVWQNGGIRYRTLANTGISVAPTAPGIYPVYLRFVSTTMSGFNPDGGSHYSDPDIPWVVYFNGGDAVHGFLRSDYGFPQSLGCVELPYANAAVVFHYDQIGTLVDIG